MDRDAIIWQATETLEIDGAEVSLSLGTLLQLVFDATTRAGWKSANSGYAEVAPAVLRTIVVYSLARGICSAEEIVTASSSDPVVRYLLGRGSVDWQTVHEFRRRNAALIQEALVQVFTGILGDRPMGQESARHRMLRAIQADSMVLDD